ncbi:F-box/kelch-repeat protein At3g23880-like [Lycium barbarum]|uniref:F-box/kelch-repeat protein At3g23880-like n=1 Tax=Lycium barbarum TaxID=112863 RepID=UPI00293EB8F4|nr:F-box/kelch-repeat protein At3g23880-like [Lycium barbarum]
MKQKKKNEGKLANSSICAPKIQKKKKKTKKANQLIVCSAPQKLNQISRGKCVAEPSNDDKTDQMDVDRRRTTAIHFKEEIIMEILSRLPVQSLLRFKCVSKFWEALISDPYFKMKHLNFAKNDQDSQKLLISQMCPKDFIFSIYCCPLSSLQPVEDVQKLDFPLNPKPNRFVIRCCYDGLVVIQVLDNLDGYRHNLLLWNPSTRESIVLPALEFKLDDCSRFGMGYDSTSGEYKILHVHQVLDRSITNEILALKGGFWRRIDKHPRGFLINLFFTPSLAFVHAAFHWIGLSRKKHFVVVSFSISNEVYREIPLPEETLSLRGRAYFGVSMLEGMLCIHSNTLHQKRFTFKLWVLKQYDVKESWIPLVALEDPLIFNAVPTYKFANGEVLFLCNFFGDLEKAFRTPSGPFVSWPQCEMHLDGYAFTESLISPKSLTY